MDIDAASLEYQTHALIKQECDEVAESRAARRRLRRATRKPARTRVICAANLRTQLLEDSRAHISDAITRHIENEITRIGGTRDEAIEIIRAIVDGPRFRIEIVCESGPFPPGEHADIVSRYCKFEAIRILRGKKPIPAAIAERWILAYAHGRIDLETALAETGVEARAP